MDELEAGELFEATTVLEGAELDATLEVDVAIETTFVLEAAAEVDVASKVDAVLEVDAALGLVVDVASKVDAVLEVDVAIETTFVLEAAAEVDVASEVDAVLEVDAALGLVVDVAIEDDPALELVVELATFTGATCEASACVPDVPVVGARRIPASEPDTGDLFAMNPPSDGAVDETERAAAPEATPDAESATGTAVATLGDWVASLNKELVVVGLVVVEVEDDESTTEATEFVLAKDPDVPGALMLPPSVELGFWVGPAIKPASPVVRGATSPG